MKRYLSAYLSSHGEVAQFLRFATVGAKISLIDIGGVYLLPLVFGINIYFARVISLSSALCVGYLLNRYFTFGGIVRGSFWKQLVGHLGVHLLGGIINYSIFALIMLWGHSALADRDWLHALPLVALVLGGIVGMSFNYFVSKRFVFKTKERRPQNVPYYPEDGADLPLLLMIFWHSLCLHFRFFRQSLDPQHRSWAPLGVRRIIFLLVIYPAFCALQMVHWLAIFLDEVFYRGYRRCSPVAPVFITGVPRSGTTFLHRSLESHGAWVSFSLWEVLFAPSILEYRMWMAVARLDHALGGFGRKFISHLLRQSSGGFSDIHGVRLDAPEEDYLAMLPVGGCFLAVLAFPWSKELWSLFDLDQKADPAQRASWLSFYNVLLKKKTYLNPGKRILSKNAAFASFIPALHQMYPDARFLVTVREPREAMSSQFSSIQGGLDFFGTRAGEGAFEKQFQRHWRTLYGGLRMCLNVDTLKERMGIIDQTDLKHNPAGAIRRLFGVLELPLGSELEGILIEMEQRSKTHRSQHFHQPEAYEWRVPGIEACLQADYGCILQHRLVPKERT